MTIKSEEFIVDVKKLGISIQLQVKTNDNNFDECVAIITHPHSLYGGNMFNNVVQGIQRVLVENGIRCAIFNFRGVGKSTGIFDNAIGEQDDLINVSKFILKNYVKIKKIFLIGYSFGSIIVLAAAEKIEYVFGVAFVAYPFGFSGNIKPNYNLTIPKLFINGKRDEIAKYGRFMEEFKKFSEQKSLYIIDNADHFYGGFEKQVGNKILEYIRKLD